MSEPQPRGAERDLYRDTWVRYLGYANEVGEAFRSLVPAAVVWLSYGVASSYVLADAIDKGKKAGEVGGFPPGLQPAQALPNSGEAQLLLIILWYLACASASCFMSTSYSCQGMWTPGSLVSKDPGTWVGLSWTEA
ncbi:mitochondrial fission process 1 [Homo sapiens]|uniref:Isoform 2 of Mitochondrial fission process protein 1 n=1 Tax=Homo sapiens TaxID=9606 RepID=Q9UDX5-2|nr:mitochondrial fission process protein 1 isoform b [Homo sapiens]KAI2597282.1 mitochondrial fission process 1 [Homo sapiens]KAI4002468.1 mitochondrial fission process 1 [Homo sapiens]|eukprot:NP_001003704.1 mitochondrial fission process protein 1 isoform b [Homo sapiens]